MEDFVKRVQRKLEELSLKERELQANLDEVQNTRSRYEAALDIWGKEMTNGVVPESPTVTGDVPDEQLAGLTMPEAIRVLLERATDHRMRTSDLARRLRMAGTTKAKRTNTAYSIVFKTLKRRDDLFYAVGTGMWGLVKYRQAVTSADSGAQGAV